MDNMIFASVAELSQQIQAKAMSAVELTTAYLNQIATVNPSLNAVVTLCADQALERAALADTALAKGELWGVLHGIPFTVKDAFDTAGVLSTGGTQGRKNYIPSANATMVERLLAAGAILLGKTNTPELTLFYDTDNLLFGKTFNPYDLTRSPGGSSGGSAAIVAAGGTAFDLGSDTGGSIRLPAHFCGSAGLKPTAGRIPRTGLIAPGGTPVDSLTQVGPIARFVDDLELLLSILSGVDGQDTATIPMPLGSSKNVNLETLRVAFYTDNGIVPVDSDVDEMVRKCARAMADYGAQVTEDRPSGLERTRAIFGRLFDTDGGAWIRRLLEQAGTTELYPFLRWTAKKDDQPEKTASDFTAVLAELETFRRSMLGFLQGYDVILAPVHAHTALPHGELTSSRYSPAFSYAQPYNLTGWPCVVVRAGSSEQGLPIGLQVIAPPWREDVALAVAKHIEKSFGGWREPSQF